MANATDLGSSENIELIKVHFRNSFRGADEDLASIDQIWQASEADPYQVIIVFNITDLTYHTGIWESTFELKRGLLSYQRSYL